MKHNTTTRTKSNMKKLLVVILALSSTSFQPVYASGDDLNGSSVPPIFFAFDQFQPDSLSPTAAPSISLSAEPSLSPTKSTSSTRSPPLVASVDPTVAPSKVLSSVPSDQPSVTASNTPTEVHSSIPSTQPPVTASNSLTEVHSAMPSAQPSVTASNTPTEGPTFMPSAQPSVTSSNIPTEVHSSMPSAQPSVTVSNIPTEGQTSMPSAQPSVTASNSPTEVHSSLPSVQPSVTSSNSPTEGPTSMPSARPSVTASNSPTEVPTSMTSAQPSVTASKSPTEVPSRKPSSSPTRAPSTRPTHFPSLVPTLFPSRSPSTSPTIVPTTLPSIIPSQNPTARNVKKYFAKLKLEFDNFSAPMDSDETKTFEQVVKDFITANKKDVGGVDIEIESATVVAQLRSLEATAGLLDYENVGSSTDTKHSARSLASSDKIGLFIEMLVTGAVSYGTLPENFSFGDAIVTGLKYDFAKLLKEINDNSSNALGTGSWGDSDDGQTDEPKRGSSLAIYIAVACSGGGMVLATLLILVHKRRVASQKNREYQEYSHDQDSIILQNGDGFLPKSSLHQSQDKLENGDWADPAEHNMKKDLRNPYSNIDNAYSYSDNIPLPKPSVHSDFVSRTEHR